MIGKEKLNKKGFTLVEVLAVIVILGILSTIGTVSIINLRKKQEEKFNNTQLQIFKQTSQTYFSDNKSKLPTVPFDTETIYLKDLIDNNYIDELLDYRKNEYDRDKSYVKVTRVGVDAEYAYIPVLYKDGDEEPPIEEKLENNSEITFTNYTKTTTQNTDEIQKLGCLIGTEKSFDCSGTNIDKYYSNYTTKVSVKAKNTNDGGIKSYIYQILKNKKVEYSSGYIIPKNGTMNDTITLNHDQYSDGEYKVRIVVYDKNATTKTVDSIPIVLDYTKPVCKPKKTPSTTWANGIDIERKKFVKVEGVCKDDGSGCVDLDTVKGVDKSSLVGRYSEYKEEMQEEVNVGKAYDYAGNIADCRKIAVNIDKTPPVCTSSGGSDKDKWTNQNMVLKGMCSDTNGSVNSGCKPETAEITRTISSENNRDISPGKIYDNAGNITKCPVQTVKIDKTAPRCVSSGGSDSWTAGDRNIIGTCYDDKGKNNTNSGNTNSGCVQNVSKLVNYSNNGSISPGTVSDKAGNSTTCSGQIAKVDKDPPSCYSSGGVSTWQLNSQTIYGTCNDGTGSGCTGNAYLTISTTKAGVYSPGTVCDNVGHCTSCGGQTVYVDADNPAIYCSVSGCGTDGCSVTVTASDTSGISRGTGVANNVKASRSFTVNDGVGHASSCSVSISKHTETRHRKGSAKTCKINVQSTCTYYKYESHGEPYCSNHGGKQSNSNSCNKSWSNCCRLPYTASCTKQQTVTSADACGIAWGKWSEWSKSKCSASTFKDCDSRTNYTSP